MMVLPDLGPMVDILDLRLYINRQHILLPMALLSSVSEYDVAVTSVII